MARKTRLACVSIALLVIVTGACCAPLTAQSTEPLGDAARRIRAEKYKAPGKAAQPQPPRPAPTPAIRQSQTEVDAWQDLYDRGEEAMSSADYVKAEKLFRESLAYAEQHKLEMGIANSSEELARALRLQRKYDEAEGFSRSALQIYRSAYGENDEPVAHSKAGLGTALVGLGRYSEAEALLLESLNAYHQQPQATLCALSFPLDGLTMLYKSKHEYSKGERIYTEAFALMASNRGTPCDNFASMLDHLADLYADDNQWDQAEKIQQGRASLVLGMQGPRSELYGDALFAVAHTKEQRRRFNEAATIYAQAADVFRQTNPPARSKLARSLESQELNLHLADKAEEAKQLHPAVRAAIRESRGDDPREKMMSIRSRALEARRNGNVEEAAQLTAEELAASRKLSARDQMIAVDDSATIHQQQQKLPEAEADLKELLGLSIATTGATSHTTAEAHINLAKFYASTQRLGEAEESYRAALALYRADETEDIKWAQALLAWLYVTDNKFDAAEALYQQSIKLAEATHDDAAMARILQCLAIVYHKTNRPSDSDAAITRALNLATQLPKGMNREWFGAAMTAALLYEETGRPLQAQEMYLRVITFMEQEFGPNTPGLRIPLDKLITLLKSQGRSSEAATYEARREKLPPMVPNPGMKQ